MALHSPNQKKETLAAAVAFFARSAARKGRPTADRLARLADTYRAAAEAANDLLRNGR